MSACCISGSVFGGEPQGREEQLGGLDVYVARPPGSDAAVLDAPKTLVLFTDVFGWRFANPRLLADRYAAALQLPVLVPDLHGGDSIASDALDFMFKPAASWAHRLKNVLVGVARAPALIAWFLRHNDSATLPRVAALLSALRQGSASRRLAVMGFCWGGRFAVLAGGGEPAAVDVVVAAHPSGVSAVDCGRMNAPPALFLCAEHDSVFPPATRAAAEAALRGRAAGPARFVIYPGTQHGFAARGNEGNEAERKAMDAAFADAVAFLKESL